VLVDLIRQFMWRTRRYELGLMQKFEGVSGALQAHERIIAALEQGDLERAAQELQGNMTGGEQPILDWLAERELGEGGAR
jgi:DNA-binding GntR family transcriptional regulator